MWFNWIFNIRYGIPNVTPNEEKTNRTSIRTQPPKAINHRSAQDKDPNGHWIDC